MKKLLIYTDGACRGNPGPGGWAALLVYGQHEKKISGAELDTTNNRMEMMAAIQSLRSLRESCSIDLYTDSQYLRKGVTEWMAQWKKRQWKRADNKPVKNEDLWRELDTQIVKHTVRWHWVKGHSGHRENDIVDALANLAIDHLLKNGIKECDKSS